MLSTTGGNAANTGRAKRANATRNTEEQTTTHAGDFNSGAEGDNPGDVVLPVQGDADPEPAAAAVPPLSEQLEAIAVDVQEAREQESAAHCQDNWERNQYSLSLMFKKLEFPQPVIHAIIYDQHYNDPVVLRSLTQKKVEQLVAAICRPEGMSDRVRDPGINVLLLIQEIITGVCFILQDQRRRGFDVLQLSLIFLSMLNSIRRLRRRAIIMPC